MLQRVIACSLALLSLCFVPTLADEAAAEDDIATVSSGDDRVEIFFLAVPPNEGIYHSYQIVRREGALWDLGDWSGWTRWAPGPDAGSQVVSARDPEGRLFVAWISQGSIWFVRQVTENGGFEGPIKIETQDLHGLTLVANKDGRLEFLALSSTGAAWSVYETAPGALIWASTLVGGRDLQALAPALYGDGRLGLVALGGDRTVYYTAQDAPGGSWQEWTGLQGRDIQAIAAAANADGRLNVAAIGNDGRFYERSQDRVGERGLGRWSEWRYRADGPFVGPVKLHANADGRLEAIMRRADMSVAHTWQTTPNGPWSEEVVTYQLGRSDGFDVTRLTDGRLVVVSFDTLTAAAPQMHAETDFAINLQPRVNSSWGVATAPPNLFVRPPPPPSIAIASFVAKPDYVDQGQYSRLEWTLGAQGGCIPADLALYERVYGQAETMILQQPAPASSGFKSVTPPPISSPVYYRLSVGCKGIGGPVTKEITLGFSPNEIEAPSIIAYGPFFDPSPPRQKMPFSVRWTFSNVGNAESNEVEVDLYIDDMQEGDSKTVAELAPGQTTIIVWNVTKEIVGSTHKAEIKDDDKSLAYASFQMDP